MNATLTAIVWGTLLLASPALAHEGPPGHEHEDYQLFALELNGHPVAYGGHTQEDCTKTWMDIFPQTVVGDKLECIHYQLKRLEVEPKVEGKL